MISEEIVIEVYRCVELQVCHPGPVEHPCEGCIASEYIVTLLLELSRERVRVVLCVHSAYVAGESGLKAEDLCECIGITQSDTCPCIRLIWRYELLHGPSPLGAEVQDSVVLLKVYALGYRSLVCARIY